MAEAAQKNGSLDVTSGVIWKQLLTLCLPVFFSSFFQQAYAFINTWVVGRYAGKEALAAIQATASLNDLVVGFSVGMGVGCGVIVSQYFGAHDDERLGAAMHNALGIALTLGICLSVLGLACIEHMLRIMSTPTQIFDESLGFARVYMGGLVFSVLFNTGSALQRAVGDTRTPSLIVASSCVVNVLLDLVFVAHMHLGALGCGLATISTLAYGSIVTLWRLCHAKGAWRVNLLRIRIEPKMAVPMVKTGLPLGIQSSVYSISNIIAQSSINSFGADTITAWGLAGRLDAMIWMVTEALASSVTTFAAQNFGARNYDRMRKGLKTSLALTALMIGGISAVIVGFAYPLAYFFMPDDNVAQLTTLVLHFIGPFYVFFSLMDNISGTIRGAGESLRPMLLTILGTCVFRVVWLLRVVPHFHDFRMILASYPITWILTGLLFVIYYRHGHWLQHAEEHEAKNLAA